MISNVVFVWHGMAWHGMPAAMHEVSSFRRRLLQHGRHGGAQKQLVCVCVCSKWATVIGVTWLCISPTNFDISHFSSSQEGDGILFLKPWWYSRYSNTTQIETPGKRLDRWKAGAMTTPSLKPTSMLSALCLKSVDYHIYHLLHDIFQFSSNIYELILRPSWNLFHQTGCQI